MSFCHPCSLPQTMGMACKLSGSLLGFSSPPPPAPGGWSRSGLPPRKESQLPSPASARLRHFCSKNLTHTHAESAHRSNRCCLSQSLKPNYRRLQELFINIYIHLNIFINVSGMDKSVYCYFSLRHYQVSFIQCSYSNHIFVLSFFLINMDSSC